MGRPIYVSVPRSILSSENPVRQEYLNTIAEMALSIELFTPDPQRGNGPLGSFLNGELYNESAVERASQRDLKVDSVHGTSLIRGCSSSGAKAYADKVLNAELGFKDQDSDKDADDGSVSRYSYYDPSVSFSTYHEPTRTTTRIYNEDENNWLRHSETPDIDLRATRISTAFRS